jgi:hypothetical protein
LHLCSYLRSAQILYINSQTSCLHPRGNLSLSFPWRRGMVGSNLAFLPFLQHTLTGGASVPVPVPDLGISPSYLTRFPLHTA